MSNKDYKEEMKETANDFIDIIKEVVPNVDFSKHERKKKIKVSQIAIELDRRFDKQKYEEMIRRGLQYRINFLLEWLKDGKSIPPKFHDEGCLGCDFPWWREQFIVSSADDEYHVLVTIELGSYSMEICLEMEVE